MALGGALGPGLVADGRGTLRGRRGTWSHPPFVSRGRRGTISHSPWFCVAGVALMALGGAAWARFSRG